MIPKWFTKENAIRFFEKDKRRRYGVHQED
jgi:hypothetical protein